MKNFEKAIRTLEFEKIRAMLAEAAPIAGAKELAKKLTPSRSVAVIRRMLAETDAAKAMQVLKGMPPFYGVVDVSDIVDRADKGAVLTPREILDVCRVFSASRALIEYRNKEENALSEYFSALSPNKYLEDKISRSFESEERLADTATDKLYEIRRKIRSAENRVRDTLQHYITGGTYAKYLQEQIVTMRDGRFVIPVKAEYRNEVKGLVHDASSSGATLFIEPISVVEANNELKILERQEKEETERYLFELSADIAGDAAVIRRNYKSISILALTFAKSQLSFSYDGCSPDISEKPMIRLNKARHPLLSKETVVPITVSIGDGYDTLVITGPNTGGKTVTLKTLGLFALMAQSGLHLPASDGCVVGVFDDILSDIGDEQSIEQSLSTFSSHMVNIVEIMERLSDRTLVLFDELGAGTDPVEGAALAVSILEAVREKHALCAATTHYAELKSFALETPGVCNASCEFDLATLRPTYKLIIGTPGKSNAFAISGRLGLPEPIIERARRYVSGENRRFEEVIEKLEAERVEMEKAHAEAEVLLAEAKAKKANMDAFVEMREAEAEKELEKARASAVRIVEGAKATEDFIMKEMDGVRRQRESENLGRAMEEAKQAIRLHLRENADILDPVDPKVLKDYVLPRPLHKGDKVVLVSINQQGVLTSDPDAKGNVSVQAGVIKTKTNIANLMLIDGETVTVKEKKEKKKASGRDMETVMNFSAELDLRGEYGDDGCLILDKYLDDARRSGVKSVRIIHGKGTGALRKAVTAFLRSDKRVASMRLGSIGEGDTGVTIVELK
ncbi:MAG: endonuclease MutS2 [Ruminococcus sp.]|nr:endonuclease MutS2 [Candidatus Apopatosoma intestinale]